MEQSKGGSGPAVSSIEQAFARYDSEAVGFLTKTQFKCAFIFLTGMKPSRRDMDLVYQYMGS